MTGSGASRVRLVPFTAVIPAEDLARIPVNPPRRTDLLPGLRLSRALSGRMLALPLAFMGFAAVMPILILSTDRDAALTFRATETVAGKVELAVPGERGRCGNNTRLTYSFTTSRGAPFRGAQTVCDDDPYGRAQNGDALPIVYVASDPSINAIAGREKNGPPFPVFFVFPLFFVAVFVPMLWPPIAQLLRDRKTFAQGVLARGRVVFARRQSTQSWPGWQGMTSRSEVFVRAEPPTGPPREVVVACSNEWLLAHLAPGSEVHVCVRGDQAMLVEVYLR